MPMMRCPGCLFEGDCATLVEVDEALNEVSETMEHFEQLMELSARLKGREEVLRRRRQEIDRVVFTHFALKRLNEKGG